MNGVDLEVLLRDLYNRTIDELHTARTDPEPIVDAYLSVEDLAGKLISQDAEIPGDALRDLAAEIRRIVIPEVGDENSRRAAATYVATAAREIERNS